MRRRHDVASKQQLFDEELDLMPMTATEEEESAQRGE